MVFAEIDLKYYARRFTKCNAYIASVYRECTPHHVPDTGFKESIWRRQKFEMIVYDFKQLKGNTTVTLAFHHGSLTVRIYKNYLDCNSSLSTYSYS